MNDTMLPDAFANLEPFASTWCLSSERERYDQRLASAMPDLTEFYEATFPLYADAMKYLDTFSLQELPAQGDESAASAVLVHLGLALDRHVATAERHRLRKCLLLSHGGAGAVSLKCESLTPSVGAEVTGVDSASLASDPDLAGAVQGALATYGVLAFRGMHLQPEHQVAFCRRLGEIDCEQGHHPVKGIYRVSLDKSKNSSADYLRGTFYWHMDGCTPLHGEPPQKATVLSAVAVAPTGGETEFASTYHAYDALSELERDEAASLRVQHTLEATQRLVFPDASADQVERWRRRPSSIHPLVWTHRSGRRSLVIGAHADHVVGMGIDEGRRLLQDLLQRATAPDRVYRHTWLPGDTLMWDNTGVVHRASPYDATSPRELLRTTVFGDEPIE